MPDLLILVGKLEQRIEALENAVRTICEVIDTDNKEIIERLKEGLKRAEAPPEEKTREDDDDERCPRCGWPLVDDPKDGCTKGNCSQRPLPPLRKEPEEKPREDDEFRGMIQEIVDNGVKCTLSPEDINRMEKWLNKPRPACEEKDKVRAIPKGKFKEHPNREIQGKGYMCQDCGVVYNYYFNFCPDCGRCHIRSCCFQGYPLGLGEGYKFDDHPRRPEEKPDEGGE